MVRAKSDRGCTLRYSITTPSERCHVGPQWDVHARAALLLKNPTCPRSARPGARKDRFVVDGGFVVEAIPVGERVTLYDAHVLAGKIPGAIEPRLAV
jgi:hypothetical protein